MRIQAGIWTAVLAMLLAATPLTASADPGQDRGRGAENRSERADAALEAAQALFSPRTKGEAQDDPHGRRTTGEPHSDHATLVLRDLVLGYDDLDPADQKVARSILARPTDGKDDPWPGVKYRGAPTSNTCAVLDGVERRVCLHWVTDPSNVNAPPLGGQDEHGVPAWVRTNQQVFEEVWQRIVVQLGYRAPRSDAGSANPGPDGRTDIYLAELSGYGMYGYCTRDEPGEQALFCVIDNDFAERMYGGSAKALRVTAAHEFFHAIQFGYTMRADSWVMEGTAAWIEDEVYDHINDNLQFLELSPLRAPHFPMDYGPAEQYNWLYGSWIWWRFLTEKFGKADAPDPTVVRDVWQRLGNGAGTFPAQRRAIAARGGDFGRTFADFGAVNRIAGRWYDEGGSYTRFVAPPASRISLSRKRPATGWRSQKLYHLSSKHVVLRPGKGIRGKWRLRVNLDLPPRFRGSQATAIVHRKDGGVRLVRARLDKQGDGRLVVPFNRRHIARVTLSLTNASTRTGKCRQGSPFTCGGWSPDSGRDFDGLVFAFRARALN
ncbi:MAG TPA: MXAN_6640 family putative metalloprotease [Nocardioidaceae bacterium]|nr:MXAN_6640 family putative metalloprotease [Nocardioidaceae bacterium]